MRPLRSPRPLRHLSVVAVTLLAAGCGAQAEGRAPVPSRPTGPDAVVVSVLVGGGFVPLEVAFATVPSVTVLGDGTVITPAPTIEIYPGPAIGPLQSTRVSSGAVDRLVRKAADLGLLSGPLDFGQPPVADAPDTIVTIAAGGETHRHVANALGIGDGEGEAPEAISDRQAANRRALKELVAATGELPPGEVEWKPAAVAVRVLGDHQPDPELPQPELAWPLALDPGVGGDGRGCLLVTGSDAEVLLNALAGANSRTPWVVGGRRVSMAFRPVVPGQPACEEPGPASG